MKPLRYRQVHLDFHTSEHVTVGDKFNPEQFKSALKSGHVDSITIFSKCHHGWSYHPTKANEMHPKLKFDLLGAQLEACKEIGVNAPVYISAGFDEKYARRHPEHVNKPAPDAPVDFLTQAYYHLLCYNTPYLDTLVAQIEEVMEKYNPTGIFLDISSPRVCYCQHCIESMKNEGLDPRNPDDARLFADKVYAQYCKRTGEAVRKYNSETTIFHNAGNITRGRRDHAHFNTHLELESLPTGGWGYDHFPMSASYARTLEMDFLGMTGKFHTSWGEFGGYKHPNALRYETALSLALGAKSSIGDQLHPSGEMNTATYELIGKAYKEVEAKEQFVKDAKHISDVAILSAEAFSGKPDRECPQDIGAVRILLEGKILFDLIDKETEFNNYRLLILPDVIRVDDNLRERLNKYLSLGGKILLSGESGLCSTQDKFAFNIGAEYLGENEFNQTYMVPNYKTVNGETAYIMYTRAQNISTREVASAYLEEPYFNRTPEHFFSHKHAPNNMEERKVGAFIKENTAYISWNIFEDYAEKGSYHLKELVLHLIGKLLPDPTIKTNLPDRAIVTFTKQKNRHVAHLLFAHTTVRGKGIEVIEDIVPLYNISLSASIPEKPEKVYKAECVNGELVKAPLDFTYTDGKVEVNLDKMDLHAMVIFE